MASTRRENRASRMLTAFGAVTVTAGAAAVVGLVSAPPANASDASTAVADIGWAAQSGGTSGGSAAAAAQIYTVSTKAQLMAAIAGTDPATGKKNKTAPKIIKWVGTIDMTEGTPYSSHSDQASRAEIKLNPNTTIIGVGTTAYLPNGWFKISKVDNVIIRNIKLTNPCDLEPKWDSGDDGGNYNSEFDGTTVDGATHVWLDHMWYTDAPYTDDKEPLGNKNADGVAKRVQCHDGAVDVKNGADYVTVSNTIIEEHDKTDLVGSSDSKTSDDGHLKVSFIGDLYRNSAERSPRVRFGQVHVADNYYVASATDVAYPFQYAIGTGLKSKIISTTNVFEVAGVAAGKCTDVVKNPNTGNPEGAFADTGSTVNGVALTGCTAPTAVGWSLPGGYAYPKLAASQVKAYVLANAGTGKI
jgi:pectate lyase